MQYVWSVPPPSTVISNSPAGIFLVLPFVWSTARSKVFSPSSVAAAPPWC